MDATIEDRLRALLGEAIAGAGAGDRLPDPAALELAAPKAREHGDFSCNVALRLAGDLGRSPRDLAAAIVEHLPASDLIERAEVAGPGFVNLFLTDAWLHEAVRAAIERGEGYVRAPRTGRRVQVEFVSANPVGPLHLGHARNAAIGDALAAILDAAGWTVEREYYFNDAGRQMDLFGASVEARYLQALGREAEVPEDGYGGGYVVDVAADIVRSHGDALADLPPEERARRLLAEGAERVLAMIRSSLDRFGVHFDVFFSERTLHERGDITRVVARLGALGATYDEDGAVFFRSTTYGDDKDRVLIRSNGAPTYFAADCAYLEDKFARGFDRLIYIWGADHHGDIVRVKGAASALGHDPDALEMILYQWVSLLRDGVPVGMSKRAGTFIALDELLDEVGADAARFILLSRSGDSPVEFDLELAKRQTMDNPVYYVQYGHARIASLLRTAAERGVDAGDPLAADLGLLTGEAERDLMRAVADLPGVIRAAADLRAPHRIVHSVQDLAGHFHRFYTECRVVGEEEPVARARLALALAAKRAIASALGLLGVSTPESMERLA